MSKVKVKKTKKKGYAPSFSSGSILDKMFKNAGIPTNTTSSDMNAALQQAIQQNKAEDPKTAALMEQALTQLKGLSNFNQLIQQAVNAGVGAKVEIPAQEVKKEDIVDAEIVEEPTEEVHVEKEEYINPRSLFGKVSLNENVKHN
jgi:hypothetical protein